jgi:F-type H+-transporting ATPase subunit delta
MLNLNASMRYAKAFFSVAEENGNSGNVLQELKSINDLVKNSADFRLLLKSPIISLLKKRRIFEAIFKNKISEITYNFLVLLVNKNRENLFEGIYLSYSILYNRAKGLILYKVITAKELDENAKIKINEFVEQETKLKPIPEYSIEPNIIGGMRINIDDWVYDASIQNQLKRLKNTFLGIN